MFPLDVFRAMPLVVIHADRFSALVEMSARTLPPPIDGGVVSIDAMKVTDTLTSTNTRMFTMMSRYGMMLSSPDSSPGADSLGCDMRRIFERCVGLSGGSCGSAM